MRCHLFDTGDGTLKVIERTTAARTGNVLGFTGSDASRLQNTESCGICNFIAYRFITLLAALVEKENTVA